MNIQRVDADKSETILFAIFNPGMRRRKRKRSARPAASAFVGGMATNIITTFWWKRKRKRGSVCVGSGTEIHRFRIPGLIVNHTD